ncbi:putative secreted protein [Xanthomonas citri pv. fuscans]|uniref:Putative secreted protein n=1 Tax=Xanthomonas campestris pv. phaseoli TaxID=317013 RepID=A0A7Z7NG80_XANCH|nr:putative secreted protein [Xanthomonas citri pv. fuscans]SOO23592.1 putative secreted protein [Xanthomonas phaseoli pv. phaseoli]
MAIMKIKFFILFLSLFFAGISGAEPSNAETIKAIEVASKDFQVRIIEMHPPSGDYSSLRDLDSYSMGIAQTPSKIIVVFLVDRRLGIIGGGGEYTLSKKDAKILSFKGYE